MDTHRTLRTAKMTREAMRAFRAEVEIMAPLRHPNLVCLFGACWDDPDDCCLVLEYAGRGSFEDLLNDAAHNAWEHPVFNVIRGIVSCMHYLHHGRCMLLCLSFFW